MKHILGFLTTAIKWLSTPIQSFKNHPENTRYVLLDDVLKALELAYHHWLDLSRQYWVIMKFKKSEPLHELHIRIQTTCKEYPELNGFDPRYGNPLFHLLQTRSLAKKEFIEKHGDKVLCIDLNLLKQLVLIILTYTFFKKYKDRAVESFAKAESDMRQLVEGHKLPGRFSWNAFVPKEERVKSEADFTFLDSYGGNSSNESQSQS